MMNAIADFDITSLSKLNKVPASIPCADCEEQSYLGTLVAELLYKNQLLRFKLAELQSTLNVGDGVKTEFELRVELHSA